uniref:Cilia- and flagella-associated protein 97 n=1 Tax=Macrostomum lignano TaxID=282301 RepID=A0A1I8I3W6_9PLAT
MHSETIQVDDWKPVDDKYLMLTNPREYRKARMKNLKLDSVLHKQLMAWRSEEQLALGQLRFASREAEQQRESLRQQLLFSRATSLACLEAQANGGESLKNQLARLRQSSDIYALDYSKSVRRPRKTAQQLRQEAAQRSAEKLETQTRAVLAAASAKRRSVAANDMASSRRDSEGRQQNA